MFHISDQVIAAAHKHSLQIIKIGESMEKLGNRLQRYNPIEQEIIEQGIIEQGIIDQEISQSCIQSEQAISQNIELYGKFIQIEGQNSLENVDKLVLNRSVELLCISVEAHIDASRCYTKAVAEFKCKLNSYLNRQK